MSRLKPVFWMGATREDLQAFPEPVRRDIGQALYAAQQEARIRRRSR